MQAARQEFARAPYADASINKMIRAAGIPRGSFYMYFDGKEDLFRHLLQEYQAGLIRCFGQTLEERRGNLLEALPAMFDRLREQREDWTGLVRLMERNADIRRGALLPEEEWSALKGWLSARVDRSGLNLRREEDLMDVFRILMNVSAPSMADAIFEENSEPARARLCAQLDILRRGIEAPVPTTT